MGDRGNQERDRMREGNIGLDRGELYCKQRNIQQTNKTREEREREGVNMNK